MPGEVRLSWMGLPPEPPADEEEWCEVCDRPVRVSCPACGDPRWPGDVEERVP